MFRMFERYQYTFDPTYADHEGRNRMAKIVCAVAGLCAVIFLGSFLYNYFYGDYTAVVMEYPRIWTSKSAEEITTNIPWGQSGDRAFLTGSWRGKWSGRSDALLIVEEVYFNRVKIYFQWNDDLLFNHRRGGNELIAGFNMKNNQPQFEWYLDTTLHKRGVLQKYTFTMNKASKTLFGVLTDLKTDSVISTIVLRKVPE